MDTAGLVIDGLGLIGTFTACVSCFEYIQFSRQFGEDFEQCLLKLDIARLRISRWGAALGLELEPHLRQHIPASDQDLAKSLLEQILEIFEDAERISGRYEKHAHVKNPESNDTLIYTADSNANPKYRRLHLTMRELAVSRQTRTGIRKKAAWALYEKKRFDRMIEDVTDLTTQLVDLFPAAQDSQKSLCKTEVSAITETQDLALLDDIASKDDAMLSAEIKLEIVNRGHHFTDWEAHGRSNFWAGDENGFGVESRGHNFARFTVSDNADVHLGNVNHGPRPNATNLETRLPLEGQLQDNAVAPKSKHVFSGFFSRRHRW